MEYEILMSQAKYHLSLASFYRDSSLTSKAIEHAVTGTALLSLAASLVK